MMEGSYAVVGASNDSTKYGHKVLDFLKRRGLKVYPINPKESEIGGLQCYPDIGACLDKNAVDVVITVVPPKVTEAIVAQCIEHGVKKIWMQPGSESDTAISLCHENGIEVTTACIMMSI